MQRSGDGARGCGERATATIGACCHDWSATSKFKLQEVRALRIARARREGEETKAVEGRARRQNLRDEVESWLKSRRC